MSESLQPVAPDDPPVGEDRGEQIDALPVLVEGARVVQVRSVPGSLPNERWPAAGTVIPAVQAAAVAAGGFVAGAAVVGLVHRRARRASALAGARRGRGGVKAHSSRSSGGKPGRAAELVQIVGSRSLLVDVHLLGSAGDR